MPVISASLFARFASRQQVSPTMQAVAALRGEFGGHQVMTTAEGEALRTGVPAEAGAAAATKKAAAKEKAPRTAKAAAAKGREAAAAGPSSGAGSTRKRAAKKS
jgi:6-phosphogluconate dehydrogenase